MKPIRPQGTMRSTKRVAVKHVHIVSELRRRVVEGLLAPGDRLPTRRELETEFGASLITVQKALDELSRDGFVFAQGSRGTFVSENPPHLNNYGVIFPRFPGGEGSFPRSWTALANEAFNVDRSQALRLNVYYGMDGHSDTPEYQRLVADIESHRLGGLIFASHPYQLVGTPLLDAPNLPRVAIMDAVAQGDMPAVGHDNTMFCRRAVEYFIARSRRKLGLVTTLEGPAAAILAGTVGMDIRPHWIQFVGIDAPECAQNSVHLLMHPDQRDRPDALLITDDNLVEPATAGLIAAGVRIPEDVEVIAHCNFPYPTPSRAPVKRLGFDVREVLRTCLKLLDLQRSGKRPPPEILVPAVFEDEVP